MRLEFIRGVFLFGKNVQGGGGRAKMLEHFLRDFDHFRLSKSAVIKNRVQRPN